MNHSFVGVEMLSLGCLACRNLLAPAQRVKSVPERKESERGKKAREESGGERREGESGQMERDKSGSERQEERERAVLHPLQGSETHRMPHLHGSFVSTAPYN